MNKIKLWIKNNPDIFGKILAILIFWILPILAFIYIGIFVH